MPEPPDHPGAVRYRLVVAYRGTRFHGWQAQTAAATWKGEAPPGGNLRTVQFVLQEALGQVLGHPLTVTGSSRTDAGVHAKGQVCHLDTTAAHIPPEGLRRAVNARLPPDVLIRSLTAVRRDFHAIGDTLDKRYQYAVWNAPDRNVFADDLAFHRWQPLDLPAMQAAAGCFLGEHDFASFARPGHGRDSTIRTVLECSVSRRGHLLVIAVRGTGFLWHQVRIMAGTLVEVGLGRFTPADIPRMLAARDRRSAGSTAPPHGLYLQWIRHHTSPPYPAPDPDTPHPPAPNP